MSDAGRRSSPVIGSLDWKGPHRCNRFRVPKNREWSQCVRAGGQNDRLFPGTFLFRRHSCFSSDVL